MNRLYAPLCAYTLLPPSSPLPPLPCLPLFPPLLNSWMLHRGRCVARAEDGEPIHFVGTHTDVTERKQVHSAIVAASDATRKLRAAEAGE